MTSAKRLARIRVMAPGFPPCWMTTAQPTAPAELRLTDQPEAAHHAAFERLVSLANVLTCYAALCGSSLQFRVEEVG